MRPLLLCSATLCRIESFEGAAIFGFVQDVVEQLLVNGTFPVCSAHLVRAYVCTCDLYDTVWGCVGAWLAVHVTLR
jgi:hypothetical protein